MKYVLTIKQKILFVTMTISTIAVLTSLVVLFVKDMRNEKVRLHEEAKLISTIIGDYMSAPLLFYDEAGGEEILSRLKYVEDLYSAYVFDQDDKAFVKYIKDNGDVDPSSLLVLKEKITLRGEELGTIQLSFRQDRIREAFISYLQMTALLLLGLFLFSYILGTILQKPISEPIRKLALVVKEITLSENYKLRVDTKNRDEVGDLYDEFNMMFDSIEERDMKLGVAREFLKDLLNSMPSMIFSVDSEGVITNVNQAALYDTGKSETELLGTAIGKIYPDFGEELSHIPEVTSKQSSFFVPEKEHKAVDGTVNFFSINISPLLNGEGAVVQFSNISKEVELKQQLLQNRKLEALGQLAGGIAHDFNNQLSGIMGFAQLIDTETDKEMLETAVEGILTASERAASLTTKLLSFSRKSKHETEVFMVNDVVKETIMVLERSLQKKISLHHELENEPLHIEGDSSQIANALLNLGINARDAMNDGGLLTYKTEKVIISKNTADLEMGEYICISVSDTGTGMSREIQEKVFEPFFTTKELGKGTGLGLAAVYGTVRQHNGVIKLESELGQGTTFFLYFPLSKSTVVTKKQTVENRDYDRMVRIAVLDDEDSVRISTKLILEKCGFEVYEFNNGRDAVEFFTNTPDHGIDVLISDNMMPDLNGLESYRLIKKVSPEIKAIIASGFCSPEDEQAYLDEGVLAIIDKPCNAQQLVDEIHNALT